LLLFARRPYHLSDKEADGWMRNQAASLSVAPGVARVELSRVQSPSARAGASWDWLIEMHLEHAGDASEAARDAVCRDLVADLRLLGMNPRLVLADATRPLEN
jgi:hypothetical protein